MGERGAMAMLDGLATALQLGGVPAVLAELNARTRYRFTGVYRADPPFLRNVHLHDRENPTLRLAGDINTLNETYCAITAASCAPFATDDAGADPRLATHAARCSVLSYLGVPIRSPDGRPWGTLCHFDVRPRVAPRGEVPVLEWAASVLAARLLRAAEDGRAAGGAGIG
jgi:GAF domain-containing protein